MSISRDRVRTTKPSCTSHPFCRWICLGEEEPWSCSCRASALTGSALVCWEHLSVELITAHQTPELFKILWLMSKKSGSQLLCSSYAKRYSQPSVHKRRANSLSLLSLSILNCQRQGLSLCVWVQQQTLEVLLWVIMELLDTNRSAQQGHKAWLPHTQTKICPNPLKPVKCREVEHPDDGSRALWTWGKLRFSGQILGSFEWFLLWFLPEKCLDKRFMTLCAALKPTQAAPFFPSPSDSGGTPGKIINWNHNLLKNFNNHSSITKRGFKREAEFSPQKCINHWISKNASWRQHPVSFPNGKMPVGPGLGPCAIWENKTNVFQGVSYGLTSPPPTPNQQKAGTKQSLERLFVWMRGCAAELPALCAQQGLGPAAGTLSGAAVTAVPISHLLRSGSSKKIWTTSHCWP